MAQGVPQCPTYPPLKPPHCWDLEISTRQEALRRTLLELVWRGLVSMEQKRQSAFLGVFGGNVTMVTCHQKPEQLAEVTDHTRRGRFA